MKRILAFLCVLALTLSLVPATAFAATQDLQAEIDAGAEEIIILEADASDITVTRDTIIDLNGHDLSGVTVLSGTLYLQDSQTADYTVADGVYGHVTNVTGNVKAAEGYLQVGDSFHAVNLDIYAMTLRASDVGVYYKSNFAADEVVAEQVESFGVALSVVTAPNAGNLETYCGYSEFTGFEAGEGANSVGTSTLLKNIMKAANGDEKNAKNAAMPVYGRAYIKTSEGYFFGETVKRSLQEQVEAIDKVWNKLSDAQKTPVLAMLESYTSVMENWNTPNIRGIQVPGADAEIEIPIEVTAENGIVTEAVTVEANGVSVTVPTGTKLEEGADKLTVIVTEKETSDAGLTLEESEVLMPMDVHVDGLAADNGAPLTIYLGKVMAENLNMGNYAVYHVENGKANEMTLIPVDEKFTAHNQYKYSLDGELTLYMATFSEVAVVSTEAQWQGNRDYSWYDDVIEKNPNATYFEIRNADQLAALSAIVGGMVGREQDSFAGKTIKLLADIDLNDAEENNKSWIFYPIGYWNNEETYERKPLAERTTAVESGIYTFMGTFDGNGHTIANFYHNTWEMKGDHNWYSAITEQYYRDGMGLFGRIYKGTVKNLTVRNFKSDGEIATTGVIAAYADGATFENIAIFDCNPRVYNIGNGGIVGCVGWYAKEAGLVTTFSNITVDNSNKISALWGSYDVPCGGIVGQYYPTSGQTSAGKPVNGGISLTNCHVSAQMDVNNDVCANYQYYAYRYAGMLIGSVSENETINGHVYPKMDGITAENCTVHFGTWNDYYYCELVANSLASYTHDHQFSRLEQVAEVNGTTITPLKGESFTVPTSGRYNYVVVNGDHATENATCYHFVDGKVHNHDDYNGDGIEDYETVNGENIRVENNRHIYLEFNNLITGYGWGVTTKAVGDLDGVTILDRAEANSVVKFESIAKDSYTTGTSVTIGELFAAEDQTEVAIQSENVQVTVSPDLTNDPDSTASGVYTASTSNWTQGTLTFTGLGAATITITDYYFCTPTVIRISVDEEKFTVVEDVGEIKKEEGTTVGNLFAAVEGAEIDSSNVTVKVNDTVIEVGEKWSEETLNFTQAGEHTVTITDGNNCVVAQQTVVVNEKKFEAKVETVQKDKEITLGELFDELDTVTVAIDDANVTLGNAATYALKRNRSSDLYIGIVGAKVLYNKENWRDSIVIFTTVGEITITITDNKYCTPTSVTVKVDKADPEFEIPTGLTATYGQKLANVLLPAGFTWKNSGTPVGQVGSNSFPAVYTPDDTDNYKIVDVILTVTVEKADPSYTVPTGLTATYGETLAAVKLPNGFTWKDAETTSVGNAGTNTFKANYNPDEANYNTIEIEVTVTVAKANPSYTVPTGLTATYGDTLAAVKLPNGFTWKDAVTTSVGNAGTNTLKAIYTPADAENYNTVEVNVTITVNKADPKVEIPTGLTATCGETLAAVKLPNGFTWKDSGLLVGNAGTNSFTAIYTPEDENYNTVEVQIAITVKEIAQKFETKFTGDFLYRIGNQNAVKLSSLFKAKDGAQIGTVSVTVQPITDASGTYTANATWTNGTIQFSGTGVVKVIITDNDACIPTELILEVVDAVNATGATSATANNVVLLNDIGSGFTVSGRYTFYGNGFTLNYTGNGQYLNNGLKQGVVTVSENGTLDNLRIVASIYPSAYMYYGETLLGDYVQGGPKSVEGDKTRYHYQLSAVAASGNATISDCYIYGGRNNIFINTGDVTVKDTVLECGTLANVQIQSNADHAVTFENVTTIQHQVNATIGDTSKVMLGAGILVGPETTENPTIVLNGYFKQYNWVTAEDANAVSDTMLTKAIIEGALNATDYNHTVDGKTASNLCIIYMNEFDAEVENNTGLPYTMGDVSIKVSGNTARGKVYSVKNATAEQIYSDVENADRSSVNGLYQPQFKYLADLGGQYVEKAEDGDEHCYREGDTIYVMFPSGDTKELDLAELVDIQKYTGQDLNLAITCKDENGNAVTVTAGKVTLFAAGEYTVTYTVTDTLFYDQDGNAITGKSETYTWDVTISVSLKDTKVPDARFEFDATKQKMGYYKPTWGDVKQYLPFLAGLKIYDYNGKAEYLRFDGSNDFNKVASITITGYESNKANVEVKLTDGGVINTRFLARANSGGGSTYTGKIKTSNNTIYFVTDSGTSNKDTTTTAAYWYVDYYKFTGNNGVAIQSAQQTFNSTGSSASTPSGSFSTTIKYTVTYDANEGNCGQTTGYATSASAAVTLPTPTRSGYLCVGWFTAASGGTRVGGAGDSYTPSANITLYAQWGKPSVVTYNANGGNVSPAFEKYEGTALTLPTPTRDGYWFTGWFDANGNKVGDAGASYQATGDITLYAQWSLIYTVTYNANGGTVSSTSAKYEGTALTLPLPTRDGYAFNGWYTAASGGTKVGDAGANYTPSANITLYAQWKAAPVVTYNANGGECSKTSEKYTNNALTLPTPTRNGYWFTGWYTAASGGTKVTSPYTPTGDITLYAQWSLVYTVTYDANGGSVSPTSAEYKGAALTLPTPTRSNYDFNGWYSAASGGSKIGAAGASYTPTSNITLYAQWTEKSSDGCVATGTLITLADGSQVKVEDLTGTEQLLVWNLETGSYDSAPIVFVDTDAEIEYEIVHLYFSDGTDVEVIYEHGFFDADLGKYVYLDANNAADYIGHSFIKQGDIANGTWETVELTEVVIEKKVTTAYSPVTFSHLCYYVDGMLSMPGGIDGLFNIFEVDTDTMAYDAEKKAQDIENYGLYTYEDFAGLIPEEAFYAFNGAYLKVAIAKGLLTWEDIAYMAERYVPLM